MDIPQINFYKFKSGIDVVEIFIGDEFKTIKDKLGKFAIEDKSTTKDNWQVLYMEQYFSADRRKKLCDTYDEPADNVKDFYLIFFIYYLAEGQILRTPYGNVKVLALQKLPGEYMNSLEFEDVD